MVGMRGGGKEKAGGRGVKGSGRRRATAAADWRAGKMVASGATSTMTMGRGDGGEDGREFKEWRDLEGGGWAMLGMLGTGAMPATRVNIVFFLVSLIPTKNNFSPGRSCLQCMAAK